MYLNDEEWEIYQTALSLKRQHTMWHKRIARGVRGRHRPKLCKFHMARLKETYRRHLEKHSAFFEKVKRYVAEQRQKRWH